MALRILGYSAFVKRGLTFFSLAPCRFKNMPLPVPSINAPTSACQVRTLFAVAAHYAPAIIFIDEVTKGEGEREL